MAIEEVPEKDRKLRRVARPRPGHADLVGGMKYHHQDLRNVWNAHLLVKRPCG